jgi:SAM-dependent methyltransferase
VRQALDGTFEPVTALYDEHFFAARSGGSAGSAASARVAVPIIQELLHPQSVLDVGCGTGSWASVWIASGIGDVVGVDGDYVDRELLQIGREQFLSHDLTQPLDLGRKFDVVTCLEVAEHLPAESAATLVESLVRHAEAVVFSAAIPGQGGTGHINEQWPSYWVDHFARSRYQPFDLLRGRLWNNRQVDWWYRQNCLLFATEDAAHRFNLSPVASPLDIVHPDLFEATRAQPIARLLRVPERASARLNSIRRSRAVRPLRSLKRSLRK